MYVAPSKKDLIGLINEKDCIGKLNHKISITYDIAYLLATQSHKAWLMLGYSKPAESGFKFEMIREGGPIVSPIGSVLFEYFSSEKSEKSGLVRELRNLFFASLLLEKTPRNMQKSLPVLIEPALMRRNLKDIWDPKFDLNEFKRARIVKGVVEYLDINRDQWGIFLNDRVKSFVGTSSGGLNGKSLQGVLFGAENLGCAIAINVREFITEQLERIERRGILIECESVNYEKLSRWNDFNFEK